MIFSDLAFSDSKNGLVFAIYMHLRSASRSNLDPEKIFSSDKYSDMRRKMNLRFKLFKRAVSTKDQEIYATSEIRNAMAQHFKDKLAEVRSAAAY